MYPTKAVVFTSLAFTKPPRFNIGEAGQIGYLATGGRMAVTTVDGKQLSIELVANARIHVQGNVVHFPG